MKTCLKSIRGAVVALSFSVAIGLCVAAGAGALVMLAAGSKPAALCAAAFAGMMGAALVLAVGLLSGARSGPGAGWENRRRRSGWEEPRKTRKRHHDLPESRDQAGERFHSEF